MWNGGLVSFVQPGVQCVPTAGPCRGPADATAVAARRVQAPEALADQLEDVEPPPDHPLLQPARELLLGMQRATSLPDRLRQLADNASSMPAATRQRSIAALAAAVRAERGSLLSVPCEPSTSGRPASAGFSSSSAARLCLPEVEQAAWQIAWLAGELGDGDMAAFAGDWGLLCKPDV